MRHHDVHPDGDRGHWGVSPSSQGDGMLVQIGEIEERRQTRILLPVHVALHLAGDLLAAAERGDAPGTAHMGDLEGPWSIVCRGGNVTVTLRDDKGIANPEATLVMPCAVVRDMAIEVTRVAGWLLSGDQTDQTHP